MEAKKLGKRYEEREEGVRGMERKRAEYKKEKDRTRNFH